MTTVYLEWDDPVQVSETDTQLRRAAYASVEDALAQARHDISLNIAVKRIMDDDFTTIMDIDEIRKEGKDG